MRRRPATLLALLAAAVGDQRWYRDRGAALRLGTELYRSGRTSRLKEPLESAVRVLSRSIELSNAIEPGQAAAPHFYLGATLALLERDGEAEVAYHECIAQDPVAAVSAWHNLGSLARYGATWSYQFPYSGVCSLKEVDDLLLVESPLWMLIILLLWSLLW